MWGQSLGLMSKYGQAGVVSSVSLCQTMHTVISEDDWLLPTWGFISLFQQVHAGKSFTQNNYFKARRILLASSEEILASCFSFSLLFKLLIPRLMKFQDPNPLLGGPTYQIIGVFLSSQCLYLTPITSWTISLTSNMAVVPHPIHWLHLAHTWPYSFRYDLTRKTPENCPWMFEAAPNSEVNSSVLSFETPVKGTRKELNYLACLFLYWTRNTESKRNGSNIQKEPLTNVRPTGSKSC